VSRSQQEEMSRNMHKRRTAKACEYVSPVKRRLLYSEHAIRCGLRDTVYAIVAPAGQGVPSQAQVKFLFAYSPSGTKYTGLARCRRVPVRFAEGARLRAKHCMAATIFWVYSTRSVRRFGFWVCSTRPFESGGSDRQGTGNAAAM
jgi:hypothetical protein